MLFVFLLTIHHESAPVLALNESSLVATTLVIGGSAMTKAKLRLVTGQAGKSRPTGVSNRMNKAVAAVPVHDTISVDDLQQLIDDWLLEGQYCLLSPKTDETRRLFLSKLMWFLKQRGYEVCSANELKEFFLYLKNGHEEPGGRFPPYSPDLNRIEPLWNALKHKIALNEKIFLTHFLRSPLCPRITSKHDLYLG